MNARSPLVLTLSLALTPVACSSPQGADGGDVGFEDTFAPRDVVDSGAIDTAPPDDAPTDTGTDAAPADTGTTMFPAGTICNDTPTRRTPPAQIGHVIIIMMENKSLSSVLSDSAAAYFNALARQCAYSTHFVDNLFDADLPSEPHYLALVAGSNCNTGLGDTTQTPGATGCITDDNDPSSHTLTIPTIFNQVSSWRAYEESMPAACDAHSTGNYACKHNPPPYFTMLNASCVSNDVATTHLVCPNIVNSACGTPTDAFARDLANDTLPALAFVTPDLLNDMHNGTVAQGDNWLHTYLPLVFASPAYLRGDVAVYVLWDEAGSNGAAQPNLFISPYIGPTVAGTTINLFSVLRAAENQLGITTHLGCAGGTPPGGRGSCPAGSTVDLRALFNM